MRIIIDKSIFKIVNGINTCYERNNVGCNYLYEYNYSNSRHYENNICQSAVEIVDQSERMFCQKVGNTLRSSTRGNRSLHVLAILAKIYTLTHTSS